MRKWIGSISEKVEENPTRVFTLSELNDQEELFLHRAALYFTPSCEIPSKHIGSGSLDATLPIATPDWTDFNIIDAYTKPRLWVDLLQRATGMIRWTFHDPAFIRFTRYDIHRIRSDHYSSGAKALLDALKVSTFGRSDGKRLYYFGAILNDSDDHIEVEYAQELVGHPGEARIRVEVAAKSE